jgi:ribulose 1,5-bisphosphate synthetase/thiazole synthase
MAEIAGGQTKKLISEPERKTPVVAETEVLVCGGGFAGVAAAISAARNGAKVLLLEKGGYLGGLCTAGLVITTPPLDNGLNADFARRLQRKGAYAPTRGSEAEIVGLNFHALDPEILKYEFLQMLLEQAVKVLFHTYIVGPVLEGRTITGVVMENKAGRQAVLAKVVVDATGDADVAASAGAPFRLFRKPMTMMFNMVGVDAEKVLARIGNWGGIRKLVQEGIDQGKLSYDLGLSPQFGSPGVYMEKLVHDGQVNVWSGNVLDLNGVDPFDLTRAEMVTREHAMRLAAFLKENIPGFEKSRIEVTANQVGVRASRQIVGEASPNSHEVKNTVFPDTVVKPYAGSEMRLPYGCLLPRGVENLLVAGRCLSAEEEALGQLRLLPVCSATGEAAGTAAALAHEKGVFPRDLQAAILQRKLTEQGVRLFE